MCSLTLYMLRNHLLTIKVRRCSRCKSYIKYSQISKKISLQVFAELCNLVRMWFLYILWHVRHLEVPCWTRVPNKIYFVIWPKLSRFFFLRYKSCEFFMLYWCRYSNRHFLGKFTLLPPKSMLLMPKINLPMKKEGYPNIKIEKLKNKNINDFYNWSKIV